MRKAIFVFSWLSIILTACNFSLAGDVTPPAEAVISANVTPMPVQAPVSVPDLAAGAEIYTNRCAPCHGAGGLGDGEQAAQLPFFPAAIGSPELAVAASPQDWYRIISRGRIQRFMPPFEAALNGQERWDVLAYVYSLSWDEDTLNRGSELYLLHQTEIDKLFKDYTPIETKLDVIETLSLLAEDARALTAYLQSRAINTGQEREPAEEVSPFAEPEAPTVLGRFRGQVIYGNGDQVPNGLEAKLYGFDHTDQVISEVMPVSESGSFAFPDVPLTDGRIFFVQVDYKGLSFFSEFLTVDAQAGSYGLDVPIYDRTTDTSQLAVERLQFFFDFPQAGVIRVVEAVTISNLGDRAVAPDENGRSSLHFSLPQQASNLSFDEGELGNRYIRDETGFGDKRAVIPGIHSREMYFAYELPYNNKLSFPIRFDLATKMLIVLLPESFELQSEGLQLQGKEDVDGTNYMIYSGVSGYQPGEEIAVQLSGKHPLGSGFTNFANDDRLLIGMAALTAAVGFAFLWLRRLPAEMPRETDQILEQISRLDDQFEKRKIGKTSYHKQRKALKARLRTAVRKKE